MAASQLVWMPAPGIRRVLKAGEEAAKKNLKVAGGLMSRHYQPLEEAVRQIHDGRIGEAVTEWVYRMHGPVGFNPRPAGLSELAHQIANYSCFTWLNGSFFVDWLIHNIDVCCWVKNAWPLSVQGMGGRQVRDTADQLFDHYTAEYTFADGTRLLAQGRHISNCWGFFGAQIIGAKGLGVLGEMQPKPRLWKGHQQKPEKLIWSYKGPPCDQYQREHDLLFDAIRNNDRTPPVTGVMTPAHGDKNVSPTQQITVDVWDFGAGIDLSNTTLTVNGTSTGAVPVGDAKHATLTYLPSTPLSGTVSVGLRARDLATTANTVDREVARLTIAGAQILTGDMDVRGALGVDREPRNGFERIRVSFRVTGNAPDDKLREIVERAQKRSAVYDMVTNGVPVEIEVTTD